MPTNPLSDHTDGTNDGLRDGDHILSPSLTNLYEGVHNNGLLIPHDTAYGDGNRNDPSNLPAAISQGAAANAIDVTACEVILDGMLYPISAATITFFSASPHLLTAAAPFATVALNPNEECLFVILATPSGFRFTQTVVIPTAAGNYPSISGATADYLSNGQGIDNKQSIVIGTVRATRIVAAGTGDLTIELLSEFNDKRVMARPSPMYLSPVTTGIVGATASVDGHTALESVHAEVGNLGEVGALWQSFDTDGNNVLYYTSKQGGARHTWRMAPNRVLVSTLAAITIKFDDSNILVLTPIGACIVTPSGTFPPGHLVEIKNKSGAFTVTFDGNVIVVSGYGRFVYTGSAWERLI